MHLFEIAFPKNRIHFFPCHGINSPFLIFAFLQLPLWKWAF